MDNITTHDIDENKGLLIKTIGKIYKKRPILRNVSMCVKAGEVVGLLGPNGAGKTTCFYAICGLIKVDYGQIILDGIDITALPMYRRARLGLGYLPQESSIFQGLSVEDNIRAILQIVEPLHDRCEAMLDILLSEFSITHLRHSPSIALSGGERRRVEIARALASSPNYILLDEPLAGIDPIAIGDIRKLIIHLRERGIAILITDHNIRDVLDLVDRAYIIHEGSVMMEGKPAEIIASEAVKSVYLGDHFSR